MPQTYDSDDCRLELEAELATAQDDLAAEIKAHKRTAKSLAWYRDRVDMLQREQRRMRDPERKLVCDIIANCALLPCTEKPLLCMKVEMDNGRIPLEQALDRMTDDWIDSGQDLSQTVFGLRDALRRAVAVVKDLERQIEALEAANADE